MTISTHSEIISHAEQRCQQKGMRLTDKRKQVLMGLLSAGKALSAYELTDYCSTLMERKMPVMSVYRILAFLQQAELVHELKLINKFAVCRHIRCQHSHAVSQFLICQQCEKVTEVDVSEQTVDALSEQAKEAGYTFTSPQIELKCLCQHCAHHLTKDKTV